MSFPIHKTHVFCFVNLVLLCIRVCKSNKDWSQIIVLMQHFEKFQFLLIKQSRSGVTTTTREQEQYMVGLCQKLHCRGFDTPFLFLVQKKDILYIHTPIKIISISSLQLSHIHLKAPDGVVGRPVPTALKSLGFESRESHGCQNCPSFHRGSILAA